MRLLDDVDVPRPARRFSGAGKVKTRHNADCAQHYQRRGAQCQGGARRRIQLDAFIVQDLFLHLDFVPVTVRLAWPRRCSPALLVGTMARGFPPSASEL